MLHDPQILISALLLGILGSGHCLGMCGGLWSTGFLAEQKLIKPINSQVLSCNDAYFNGALFRQVV